MKKKWWLIGGASLACASIAAWIYFEMFVKEYETFSSRDHETGWVVTSFCRFRDHSYFAYLKIEDPTTSEQVLFEELDVNLSADNPENCPYYAPESVRIDRKAGIVIVKTRSQFVPSVTLKLPASRSSKR